MSNISYIYIQTSKNFSSTKCYYFIFYFFVFTQNAPFQIIINTELSLKGYSGIE